MRPLIKAVLILVLLTSSAFAEEEFGDFSAPMKFTLAGNGGNCNGCQWTSAIGTITEDTPNEFKKFFANNPYSQTVYMHSPGGNLIAGMELGALFRKHGMVTDIGQTYQVKGEHYEETQRGVCASACAYAFLGGESRSIMEGSRIGFHQFYGNKKILEANSANPNTAYQLSSDQVISGLIASYMVEMGIDARVLTLASFAGKDELSSPDSAQLIAYNVVTSDDFQPLEIDFFGQGIRASQVSMNTRYPIKRLSAFCAEKNGLKQPIFAFDSIRLNGENDELKSWINGITFQAGEGTAIKLPQDLYIVVNTESITSILISLPPKLVAAALNADSFYFEIDSPRAMFGTFVGGGFGYADPDNRKKLEMAWSNCSSI